MSHTYTAKPFAPLGTTLFVIWADNRPVHEQQFAPYSKSCDDAEEKGGRKGCGAVMTFHYTVKNRRPMPFDRLVPVGEPVPMPGEPHLLVQEVENWTHFASCKHGPENARRRALWFVDQRQRKEMGR